APETIYSVDEQNKMLSPIASGEAYTGAGYKFGAEQVASPAAYQGYSVAASITRADQLAQIKSDLNDYQNSLYSPTIAAKQRQSSQLTDQMATAQNDAATAE